MTLLPQIDPTVVAPIGFTAIGAMVVLVEDALLTRRRSLLGRSVTPAYAGTLIAFTAVVFLALALYVTAVAFASGDSLPFQFANPMFVSDPFGSFASALVIVAGMLTCMLSVAYLSELGIHHGAYYGLVLLSVSGAMLLLGAVDLLTLYVGLEGMTLPVYALAGFDRGRRRSNEAAIKYFVTGSFASAILLYGMALTYGATGSTSFDAIRAAFDPTSPMAMIGLGAMLTGFAFKLAAAPLHQWAPDVYEGAPAPVTAYMSVVVKAAAIAALLRFVATAVGPEIEELATPLALLAGLSLVVGNVMAIVQENVKRMLAYSSIGHAGAMLAGLVAGNPQGYGAVAFYFAAYALMNLGAFAVLIALARRGDECETVAEFAGLAGTRPGLAAAMTLFMFSLAGIPGTVGFIAKFNLVLAIVQVGNIWLPTAIAITTVVSFFYYLRIPVLMWMRETPGEPNTRRVASGEALALFVCAFLVLYLGFFPSHGMLPWLGIELPLLDWANDSVRHFFGS